MSEYLNQSFKATNAATFEKSFVYLTDDAANRLRTPAAHALLETKLAQKRGDFLITLKDVREVSADKKNIIYEVTFTEGTPASTTTQRRLAEMAKAANGDWKIQRIVAVRELIEFDNEMVVF